MIVPWSGAPTDAEAWRANAAPDSSAALEARDGRLRLTFRLGGATSWAIARRDVAARLPDHYVAVLRVRGRVAAGELQLKLVDAGGTNVWWWRRKGLVLDEGTPTTLVLRRASLEFAWGPASGGDPRALGAVKLAVATGDGTPGWLEIEALRIEPRAVPAGPPRVHALRHVADAGGDGVELDLGEVRECGGVVVAYAPGSPAPACRVTASLDGDRWTEVARFGPARAGDGGRRWLRTGELEARTLRVVHEAPAVVTDATVVPIELAVSPARWAAARARAAPRGRYPRHLTGEAADWAVVGLDGDDRKALLGADGALETGLESFTLEPFVWTGERLVTWADVAARPAWADGVLPLPAVRWHAAPVALEVAACTIGRPGAAVVVARYRVTNAGDAPRAVRLFVAVRPFQVTPAWQSLNVAPAVAPIDRLALEGDARVRVERAGEPPRRVVAVTAPDAFGAARSDDGLAALDRGAVPEGGAAAEDALGFAEGALGFDLALAPGASADVVVAVPLHDGPAHDLPAGLARDAAAAWAAARFADAAAAWRERLARVPIALPPSAAPFEESLRASLAWILLNREGPRIQPGPRCYRRSWIRDGTLTGTALAEMGYGDEARAFLRWYAPHQRPDGFVPCCVDHQGVDPVPEHDSHGQLAWGVVEVARLTGDDAFLRELWPHVVAAVGAIERLRDGTGLLPESISHEGYASQPVHSYWDDFFAVRGVAHAADAATELGDAAAAARFARLRDELRRALHDSIARTIATRGIDHVPGSLELGDFDPTSTAIAFDPCEEAERLPAAALERTFERYWAELDARRRGDHANDAYTPYEIRNAVALLGLGWTARAVALLEWLIGDQRPPAWRQWPEVAHADRRAPRFVGDLPHGWVASSYVRTLRRMVAYERERDGALVVAGGVPAAWVREAPGLRVRGLPTRWGPLDVALVADAPGGAVRVTFDAPPPRPPGGLVLVSPLAPSRPPLVLTGDVARELVLPA